MIKYQYPNSIICLTEESVETLYLINQQHLIKGVSSFVKRPQAAQSLPKVSQFTKSNIEKIISFKPDLVLGFSDIQKDIAKELIGKGINVWISNQRTIGEILSYILMLSSMVGQSQAGVDLCGKLSQKIDNILLKADKLKYKPKVYFEEWDDPKISAIKWVSELISLAGGVDIFNELSSGTLASERFVSDEQIIERNPDIIFGCWCGKKFRKDKFMAREGYEKISAVKNNQIFELEPEIFLQPGPAPLLEGLDILHDYFARLN